MNESFNIFILDKLLMNKKMYQEIRLIERKKRYEMHTNCLFS